MLTLYASALMLLITLYPSLPYQDRSAEYSADITGGKGKSKVWYYDGSKNRSNRPDPSCETWEFSENTVTITPCQGAARGFTWNVFLDKEDGYHKITVDGDTYFLKPPTKDTGSQILYMEFEKRYRTQGSRSLHKYFHARS
jgi:hypothetical protein